MYDSVTNARIGAPATSKQGSVMQRADKNFGGVTYTSIANDGQASELWRFSNQGGGPLGTVRWVGKKEAFTTPGSAAYGAPPGNEGDVSSYTGEYGEVQVGAGPFAGTQRPMANNNTDLSYEKGHILPKQAGGKGASNNLFWQNAGQNSGATWKGFETNATNYLQDGGAGYRYYEVTTA